MSTFRKFGDLPAFLDRVVGRDSADLSSWNSHVGSTVPAVNIVENLDDFEIEVAAPGYAKEDFKVVLQNNLLTISASQEGQVSGNNQRKYTRREYDYSNWQRVFSLPDSVQTEQINASYENGILNLVVPKKEEARKKAPKTIEIK